MTDSWYVVMATPQKEFRAATELRERGYVVYVPPRRLSVKSRSGRSHMRTLPLYPSYIFVFGLVPWNEMNPRHPSFLKDRKDDKRLLRGALTMKDDVGAHVPFAIREEVIGKIAVQCFEIERDALRPRQPSIKVGDVAVMRAGPLEGHSGEIVSVSKGEAEIALRIFNSVRTVRAKIDKLEAAE